MKKFKKKVFNSEILMKLTLQDWWSMDFSCLSKKIGNVNG